MNSRILTPISKILPSVTTPIILGAMAGASGGDLAGRVSKAGGFGFIGAGYYKPQVLRQQVEKAYRHLGIINRDDLSNKHRRADVGIGILVWRLTELNGGIKPPLDATEKFIESNPNSSALELIEELVRARPRAIWLSYGDDQEMVGWKRVIEAKDRQANSDLAGNMEESIKYFVVVGRECELELAVEGCGADVLVVQGNESGGHGHSQSPPLNTLLSTVMARLGQLKKNTPTAVIPPILAAGGLADGQHLASMLCLGCVGAVYGTRFVLTHESEYSTKQKKAMIKARFDQTLRSFAYDDARGTLGWPAGVDGRGLMSKTVQDYDNDMQLTDNGGNDGSARRMQRYNQAVKETDVERIVTWAGTGVGSMHHILGPEEVVKDITKEAVHALGKASAYVEV